MKCPECECVEDKVLETRVSKDKAIIRRRRECVSCGYRFTTQEELVKSEIYVIKNDGTREELNLQKLRHGIDIACQKRPVDAKQRDIIVKAALEEIEKNYEREVSSRQIGEIIMTLLKDVDEVAYVRFASVYRNFKDAAEFVEEIRELYTSK